MNFCNVSDNIEGVEGKSNVGKNKALSNMWKCIQTWYLNTQLYDTLLSSIFNHLSIQNKELHNDKIKTQIWLVKILYFELSLSIK